MNLVEYLQLSKRNVLFNWHLFSRNYAKNSALLPACWTSSSLVPVFKNSWVPPELSIYRLISLLNFGGKVHEALIHDQFLNILLSTTSYRSHYDFPFARSTAEMSMALTEFLHQLLDKNDEVRAVAVDISKAFHRLWHAGFLREIKSYGITESIFVLIQSFLTGRVMNVVLNKLATTSFHTNADVAQGSILGWGKKCFVNFNVPKIKRMSFYHPSLIFSLPSAWLILKESIVRILGFTFSPDMKWGYYIESTATSTARNVGLQCRKRKYFSSEAILQICK